jgi:hypothetical protein
MYRRPKFLEILHEIREEMSREADYDMDLFAELARSGKKPIVKREFKVGDGELKLEPLTTDHQHLTTDN